MASDLSTQDELIQQRRDLMQPTPVRGAHVPKWLRLALIREFKPERWQMDGESVLHHACPESRWLDHWGSTTLHDGRLAFVSEPYHLTPFDIQQIDYVATAIKAQWWIDANSWWYPGRTIRVVIAEHRQGSEPGARG